MSKARAYLELARPFTLLPPALGVLSGAASAWGAGHAKPALTWALVVPVIFGTMMAAVLNRPPTRSTRSDLDSTS
jgi:1,4-dihydroxy-2-naphthoate octaprenyltransferase